VDARLDPSDAKFVDVIHTDVNSIFAMGFGSKDPMGHADYYPNGGKNQPGCNLGLTDIDSLENAKQYVVCNHERCLKIFIEAMRAKAEGRTCHFKAHRCSSYESYLKEECQACGEGCTSIGPEALLTRPNRGEESLVKMYLMTLDKAPFCGENFVDFAANFPAGFEERKGQIFVKMDLTSQGGDVIEQELTTSTKDSLVPERSIHHLGVERANIDIDQIKEVQVKFKKYWSYFEPSTWGNQKIKLHSAALRQLPSDESIVPEGPQSEFCLEGAKDIELESDHEEWKTLVRCH